MADVAKWVFVNYTIIKHLLVSWFETRSCSERWKIQTKTNNGMFALAHVYQHTFLFKGCDSSTDIGHFHLDCRWFERCSE